VQDKPKSILRKAGRAATDTVRTSAQSRLLCIFAQALLTESNAAIFQLWLPPWDGLMAAKSDRLSNGSLLQPGRDVSVPPAPLDDF
jgi:hypothetical protein